ncbi:3154_t:CDS:2, partial [Gigaspora margarita]
MSIKKFFEKLIIEEISLESNINIDSFKTIESVELSQSIDSTAIQASFDCEIIEITKIFGINIYYHLKSNNLTTSHSVSSPNALDILMQNSCKMQIHLPMGDGLQLKMLIHKENISLIVCTKQSGTLICGHLKFKERSYHIPKLFLEFFGRANSELYKALRKPFDANELSLHCQTLASFTTSLNSQITLDNRIKYHQLEVTLKDLPLWKLINLEKYLPTDPVGEYRFNSGNNVFNAISVWKIDDNADETIMIQRNSHIVNELQENVLYYNSYAMRINYLHTCNLLLPKAKPAVLRAIYQEFEQLHCIPDLVPGEGLHYKSFEELYGISTTEEYRPSLKNAKLKITKSDKTKGTIIAKYIMPFSPSSIYAKNVGITVTCTECKKLCLLFSTKKLLAKERKILESFLDTVLYTCGMSFHNTCDLASTGLINIPSINTNDDNSQQEDLQSDDPQPQSDDLDLQDDDLQSEYLQDYSQQFDENQQNINALAGPSYSNIESTEISDEEISDKDSYKEKEKEKMNDKTPNEIASFDKKIVIDPLYELFQKVFVNDFWNCASPIEKPYYLAGIFSLDEQPLCIKCNGKPLLKKRFKWVK